MNDNTTAASNGGVDGTSGVGNDALQRELDEILDDLCAEVAAAYERANRKWKRLRRGKTDG